MKQRVIPRWVHATGEMPRQSGFAPDAEAQAAAAELLRLHAECEALRADAERGRWLVDWLEQTGLILAQFCQPAVGTRAEDWFVFWRPLCADGTSIPEGYAKTPEGAIDAARAAKEQSNG